MIGCRCSSRQHGIASGVTLAFALMPKIGCPLCAPLLAAALSMLGLSLQLVGWVLTLVAFAFFCVAIWMVAFDRRNRAPGLLALAASVLMLTGRLFDLPVETRYLGGAGFASALLWRAWIRIRWQRIGSASVTLGES